MIFVVGFLILSLRFGIYNAETYAETFIYTSKYVACIEDGQYRVFPYNRWSSNNVSNDACVDHCAAFTVYTYAGTEEGMDCYCGVKGDKMTKANETDCDMPCHGNETQICGGIYRLSVYEIFFEKITTSSHPMTSLADTTTNFKRSTRVDLSSPLTLFVDTTTDLKHSTQMDLSSPRTSLADTTTNLIRSTQTDLSSVKPSHTDQGNSAYSSLRSSVSTSAEWTSVESFSSKTTTTDTWTQVSTDTSNSECVCPCEYVSVVNKTKEELIAIATKDLYIDKTQTSTYKNSKKSAEDHRSSSRNIGIVGVLVISITMSLLILVDCINGPFQQMWVCVTKHKNTTHY